MSPLSTQVDDVAGPRLAGHDVARLQVVDVVVAGEAADLAVVDVLLELLDRGGALVVGEVLGVGAGTMSMNPIVSRISREQLDLALEVRAGEQLLEAARPGR